MNRIILFFILFATILVNQALYSKNDHIQENCLSLKVEIEKERYIIGELILLKITIKNISTNLLFAAYPVIYVANIHCELFRNGERIYLSQSGGDMIPTRFHPGQERCNISDLNSECGTEKVGRYKFLPIGNYQFKVRFDYGLKKGISPFEVVTLYTPIETINFEIFDNAKGQKFLNTLKELNSFPLQSEKHKEIVANAISQSDTSSFNTLLRWMELGWRSIRSSLYKGNSDSYADFISDYKNNFISALVIWNALKEYRVKNKISSLDIDSVRIEYLHIVSKKYEGTFFGRYSSARYEDLLIEQNDLKN